MKKGLMEIVFILDQSGSMAGLEADTIGGYNSMLSKQKTEEGEAIISTVLFDGEVEVLLVSCARASGSAQMMEAAFDSEDLLDDIREDYNRRHGASDR